MSPQLLKTDKPASSGHSGAGSVIGGYSVLARIGRGGMGAVFKAIQLSMNRLVALKILPLSLAKDRSYIKRFLREARSAAQMNHPNLTRVYDVGSYRGVFYFSMEFVEGQNLLDLIKSEGNIKPETATDIILQAARGLDHAHSHSIVHRDIKPENIMVASEGTVKVTDMGLAKRMDSSDHDITVTGQVIGTPCYMSPEQITNPKAVDPRSDIYSLGATLFHMVTGRRPFRGETSAQTMLKVVGEEPDWPRGGEIPIPMRRIIKKMMAKDPARRHQNIEQVIRDLLYLKERVFSPHRSRRSPLLRAYSSARFNLPSSHAALIPDTPSRRLPLVLAVASLLVVLAAVLLSSSSGQSAEGPQNQEFLQPEPAPLERPEPGLSFSKYFKRAMELADKERWENALLYFDAATTSNPLSFDAWNNRGTCLWHLGRFEEGIESFKKAIDINADVPDFHINLGLALLELGRPREALNEFEAAISLDPESRNGWDGKSKALNELELFKEAGEAAWKARQLKAK